MEKEHIKKVYTFNKSQFTSVTFLYISKLQIEVTDDFLVKVTSRWVRIYKMRCTQVLPTAPIAVNFNLKYCLFLNNVVPIMLH